MSRKELVERVGISSSYLSEIESAKKPVSLDLVEKYSSTFDIPVSSILFFSEHLTSDSAGEKARSYLASKVVKMLDWLEEKDSVSRDTAP